jgi:uncharacterized protein (DUF1800 family)
MLNADDDCLTERSGAGHSPATPAPQRSALAASVLAGLLAGCGGGGAAPGAPGPVPPPTREPVTPERAARFLAQASMGATREQIAMVQSLGYAAWLDEQFALPPSRTRWEWLIAGGYNRAAEFTTEAGADACQWKKLLTSHDTLRQRMTLALSEILVTAVTGFTCAGWTAFSVAAYLDLLEANAFGNYRTLLQQVSLSAPMAEFLTYLGNVKANPDTGAMPDENYARELMQLFTIGLVELNLDGTPRLVDGKARETYVQDDVIGLARVFTGWHFDMAGGDAQTPDYKRRPLVQTAANHETGSKTFLGHTVAAGTDGAASLGEALDTIFAHPNVAPFISGQLIQRLVCSNPSPAYVARVATVFNNDGMGVKGNLKAVIKSILMDNEARTDASLKQPAFGKLREPILRLAAWARAFAVSSPSESWAIGDTSDPALCLGQSPLRSPSVFNFFRPGYVPPNTTLGRAGLVAPEFQITNESTVVGYVNYMQEMVVSGAGDVQADYRALLPLADDAGALLAELNLLLAAGQLSPPTLALMRGALDGMPDGAPAARLQRIYAALVMTMAAPEFIVQK